MPGATLELLAGHAGATTALLQFVKVCGSPVYVAGGAGCQVGTCLTASAVRARRLRMLAETKVKRPYNECLGAMMSGLEGDCLVLHNGSEEEQLLWDESRDC